MYIIMRMRMVLFAVRAAAAGRRCPRLRACRQRMRAQTRTPSTKPAPSQPCAWPRPAAFLWRWEMCRARLYTICFSMTALHRCLVKWELRQQPWNCPCHPRAALRQSSNQPSRVERNDHWRNDDGPARPLRTTLDHTSSSARVQVARAAGREEYRPRHRPPK